MYFELSIAEILCTAMYEISINNNIVCLFEKNIRIEEE